jgi:ferrous iron transport protein B
LSAAAATAGLSLSLVGVPNCGKTALFNRLTGSRQKVANYPGVTVERKEGRFLGPTSGRAYRLLDLPGACSPRVWMRPSPATSSWGAMPRNRPRI